MNIWCWISLKLYKTDTQLPWNTNTGTNINTRATQRCRPNLEWSWVAVSTGIGNMGSHKFYVTCVGPSRATTHGHPLLQCVYNKQCQLLFSIASGRAILETTTSLPVTVFHLTCVMPISGKPFQPINLHFGDKQNNQTAKPQIQKLMSALHRTMKTPQNVLKMSTTTSWAWHKPRDGKRVTDWMLQQQSNGPAFSIRISLYFSSVRRR